MVVDQNFPRVKKYFLLVIFFLLFTSKGYSNNYKFTKIIKLNEPWGSSFINNDEIIITEKSGKIKIVNVVSKEVTEIKHNLNFLEVGQGGLLDIIYQDNTLWISYSENRGDSKTSTSIAKAQLNKQELNFKNAVKNLNLTIGRDINSRWNFIDKIDTTIQIFNYKELARNTLSDNTNIKNQYYNIQLSKQDIKLTLAPFYPIISINSGASFNESTYDIGNLSSTIDNTGENINYFANFSINFRIFDGGKLYRNLRSVKIQKQIFELELEKIKKEVLYQLSINNDKYNSRINAYSLNQKAFKIAEENFKLATEKKNRGVINSFMLRDIEIAYITSGINAQQSAYNLMESKLSLLKISGNITRDFNMLKND